MISASVLVSVHFQDSRVDRIKVLRESDLAPSLRSDRNVAKSWRNLDL